MANVQVFQRHAHLASAVRLEFVNGRNGKVAKAVMTAISNTRCGSSDFALCDLSRSVARLANLRNASQKAVKKKCSDLHFGVLCAT